MPSINLQTKTAELSQTARAARKLTRPLACPHHLPGIGSPVIASARLGTGPRPAWSTTPCRSTKAVCFSRTQISLSNFEFALQACLPPMLVALLEPDVAFAVPVDQRAGCLALTHEKRVSAKMWDACFTRRVASTLF